MYRALIYVLPNAGQPNSKKSVQSSECLMYRDSMYRAVTVIGKKPEIIIYCDNNAVIEIIQNSKYRNKTKHIDVQYHFARKHFNIGTYKLERVESNNNLADIMTKPLDSNHFTNNARKLGLNSQSQVLGGVSNK